MRYSDTLYHYGVGHKDGGHSGRYPYGSGKDPHQDIKRKDHIKRLKAIGNFAAGAAALGGMYALSKKFGNSIGDAVLKASKKPNVSSFAKNAAYSYLMGTGGHLLGSEIERQYNRKRIREGKKPQYTSFKQYKKTLKPSPISAALTGIYAVTSGLPAGAGYLAGSTLSTGTALLDAYAREKIRKKRRENRKN